MKKLLRLAESGFMVLSLLFCTGGILPVILAGGISEGMEGPEPDFALSRSVFIGLSVLALVLVSPYWKTALYLLNREKWIFIFTGVTIFSTLWSFAPDITLRRGLSLLATTILGAYFATRYSLRQQLQLLAWTFGIAVVLSFVFALALPLYGVEHGVHAGAWRGIYFNKNLLGKMMVLSAAIFWLLATNMQRKRPLFWLGLILSVSLILLSASVSSLLNLLMLIFACSVFRTLRWRSEIMIPTVLFLSVAVGLFYAWFTSNAEILLGSLGRETNLTGRPDLWFAVLKKIGQNLWLGYGYSGFWLGLDSEGGSVWREIHWKAPNSHNGFLDLFLELGLLGGSIFFLGLWNSLSKCLSWVRLTKTAEGLWPLTFITYTLLSNLTESSLLGPNSLFWLLYVGMSLSMFIHPERQDSFQSYIKDDSHDSSSKIFATRTWSI